MRKLEPWYLEFGQRLQKAREQLGIHQGELAEAVGLTRVSIANIEAGRQRLMAHLAAQVAHALRFELPPDKSLTIQREMRPAYTLRRKRDG